MKIIIFSILLHVRIVNIKMQDRIKIDIIKKMILAKNIDRIILTQKKIIM